ncbi:MAG TPA: cytochrome c oxidase subunit II [Gaiella sp.]|nr:cytochrome c oxidase subunit II [Gaiella sp.]
MRPKPLVIVGVLLGALLLPAASALAGNGGFAPVPPESPNADGIRQSFLFISAFVFAIFLLVEVLLVAFVLRYRRRNRPRHADGAQIHGANRLELAWTVGPVLILFAIAAFVFAKLPGIQDVPAASAGSRNMVVDVTGTQFMWEFRYPNGVITVDRLRAPQGRTIELDVTAPDWDVIHSWWIPSLGGKMDAIPGKLNKTWFSAKRTGVFQGQCAELCGLYHAKMLASVEVMPAAEFDAWLEERRSQQEAGTSPLGQELWEGSCAKCHGAEGEGGYGPRIAGSALVQDDQALATLLHNGGIKMPPVGTDWTDEEIAAITTYVKESVGNQG